MRGAEIELSNQENTSCVTQYTGHVFTTKGITKMMQCIMEQRLIQVRITVLEASLQADLAGQQITLVAYPMSAAPCALWRDI